eukprot:GGOE01046426.1.p1 GENE.GGOE01046426.1~~GGOE01046426.1.p1  ORF type:complete len:148 (+),score=4.12 GGOE01046426.1:98-541(+)
MALTDCTQQMPSTLWQKGLGDRAKGQAVEKRTRRTVRAMLAAAVYYEGRSSRLRRRWGKKEKPFDPVLIGKRFLCSAKMFHVHKWAASGKAAQILERRAPKGFGGKCQPRRPCGTATPTEGPGGTPEATEAQLCAGVLKRKGPLCPE